MDLGSAFEFFLEIVAKSFQDFDEQGVSGSGSTASTASTNDTPRLRRRLQNRDRNLSFNQLNYGSKNQHLNSSILPKNKKRTKRQLISLSGSLTDHASIQRRHFMKFSAFRVRLWYGFSPANIVKMVIYCLSWLVKLFCDLVVLRRIKNTQKIQKWEVSLLKYHRKIHFLVFNLIIVEMAYFGTRTILHLELARRLWWPLGILSLCFV